MKRQKSEEEKLSKLQKTYGSRWVNLNAVKIKISSIKYKANL